MGREREREGKGVSEERKGPRGGDRTSGVGHKRKYKGTGIYGNWKIN